MSMDDLIPLDIDQSLLALAQSLSDLTEVALRGVVRSDRIREASSLVWVIAIGSDQNSIREALTLIERYDSRLPYEAPASMARGAMFAMKAILQEAAPGEDRVSSSDPMIADLDTMRRVVSVLNHNKRMSLSALAERTGRTMSETHAALRRLTALQVVKRDPSAHGEVYCVVAGNDAVGV